jgi:hypothetical protein
MYEGEWKTVANRFGQSNFPRQLFRSTPFIFSLDDRECQKNAVWLDIGMDHASLVQMSEGIQNVKDDNLHIFFKQATVSKTGTNAVSFCQFTWTFAGAHPVVTTVLMLAFVIPVFREYCAAKKEFTFMAAFVMT